jgi:hypothetical protein
VHATQLPHFQNRIQELVPELPFTRCSRAVDLPSLPLWALALVGLLGLAVVVQTFRLARRTSLPARRLAGARLRGAEGERRARPLLEDLGFAIVGQQVSGRYELLVDGESVAFDLRADFVVTQGSRRYVAEVKTGTYAPRLETAATRRQLLEYGVAFDVDGVLLVDADVGEIRLVELLPRARGAESSTPSFVWLAAAVMGGALLSAVLGLRLP